MQSSDELVVFLSSGIRYDNIESIRKGRYTIHIDFADSKELLRFLLDSNDNHTNTDFYTIKSIIKNIGYTNTTFNFECCDGCSLYKITPTSTIDEYNTHYFKDKTVTQDIINLIEHLLHQESIVMFSDFSFMALIHNWNTENWGDCPFRNISSISNTINVSFPLEEAKQSQFGQLNHLASMVIPDEKTDSGEVSSFTISVNTLPGTLIYDIKETIHPNLTLYVHSVIQDSDMLNIKYNNSIAYGSKNMSGLPVHTVVNFNNRKGVMIVSNIHFKDLYNVNVNIEEIKRRSRELFTVQRSNELIRNLSSTNSIPRAITDSYVAEIINASNPKNKSFRKVHTI